MDSLQTEEDYNALSEKIIGAAIEVSRALGPGLLESVYEACLVEELQQRGLQVRQQVHLPVVYKGKTLTKEFVIDLLVEDAIIVELKAVEQLTGLHAAQVKTYLRLANKRLGLVLNFNVEVLAKQGLKRVVNQFFQEYIKQAISQ
jgi:GxxExxY protein